MSICKAQLREHLQCANATNVQQTDTSSGPAWIVRSRQPDPADDQAMNSRLWVRQQKMHGSQGCYGEQVELTVDDNWQITDVGDQERQRLAHRRIKLFT